MASDNTIVLASGNKGKLAEFTALFADFGVQVKAQSAWGVESPVEDGLSFVENALIKARHAANETGLPALADDSGISVKALNGAPGIYSARYAGPDASDQDNIAKLLQDLDVLGSDDRSACFHCVLVYVRTADDPVPLIAHGQWPGTILRQASGEGGFGYDPVFHVTDRQCTAAQLSKQEKNAISHRGQAIRLLIEQLRQQGLIGQKS